jgi:hypothetical protein
MVAQQVLVLFVVVRIRLGQRLNKSVDIQNSISTDFLLQENRYGYTSLGIFILPLIIYNIVLL